MQGEPHSGDIHMENARTSLQSLARFSWPGEQRNFKGELAQAQTVRAEGNDSLGARGAVVLLINPNQIKPFWLPGACPNWRVALCPLWLVAAGVWLSGSGLPVRSGWLV